MLHLADNVALGLDSSYQKPGTVLFKQSVFFQSLHSGEEKQTINTFLKLIRQFPGGPVVKTSSSKAGGVGLIPGQGAKNPRASWPKKQNSEKKT